MAQQVKNPTSIHKDVGLSPGLAQWVKDLALPWLWRRPAATALIGPLAWEPPYAVSVVLKKKTQAKLPREIIPLLFQKINYLKIFKTESKYINERAVFSYLTI